MNHNFFISIIFYLFIIFSFNFTVIKAEEINNKIREIKTMDEIHSNFFLPVIKTIKEENNKEQKELKNENSKTTTSNTIPNNSYTDTITSNIKIENANTTLKISNSDSTNIDSRDSKDNIKTDNMDISDVNSLPIEKNIADSPVINIVDVGTENTNNEVSVSNDKIRIDIPHEITSIPTKDKPSTIELENIKDFKINNIEVKKITNSNNLNFQKSSILKTSIKQSVSDITNADLKVKNRNIPKKEDKFDKINDKTNQITALGSAMGAIDLGSTPTKKIRLGAGVGNSSSSQAVAVGVGYAPTEKLRLNTKFSSSTESINNNSISIGASYDLDI